MVFTARKGAGPDGAGVGRRRALFDGRLDDDSAMEVTPSTLSEIQYVISSDYRFPQSGRMPHESLLTEAPSWQPGHDLSGAIMS